MKFGAMAWLMVLVMAMMASRGDGLQLDLQSSATKCLSEDIHSNVLVLAHYHIAAAPSPHHKISVKVMSPYENTLYHEENVSSGQFSLTTTESGSYSACFWISSSQQDQTVSVDLDWKIGIMAKDWEFIARKDKVEGVELELLKLQGLVDSIHQNLLYLKEQEKNMREVSERTNARVAWFSLASLTVCVLLAVWQLWHLKSYFERKKLL